MFFTSAPKRNSASCGAASLEPKWPVKLESKIFPLTPDFGTSIRCAAQPPPAKAKQIRIVILSAGCASRSEGQPQSKDPYLLDVISESQGVSTFVGGRLQRPENPS